VPEINKALVTTLKLAQRFKAAVLLLHVTATPETFNWYPQAYGVVISKEQILEQNGNIRNSFTHSSRLVIWKKVQSIRG
jgi:hypothetical protein